MRANEFITEEQLDEDWKKMAGAAAAAGAMALGSMGMNKSAPIEQPSTPITQQSQQAQKSQPTHKAAPKIFHATSSNPQVETFLMKTAKAAGLQGTELAQFLAQAKHETNNFGRLTEKPQPGVANYFAKKYDPKFAPKTAKILGNTKSPIIKNHKVIYPGDGEMYKGRGYIQLTGRDNYRMAGNALNIDLLSNPALAERPDVAAKIALWYWKTRVKPHVQDFNDTASVTKRINPAGFGLEDRHANFKNYMRMI